MAARTLTAIEVALVQRWVRRARIWLWILLPVVALVALGLPAIGIVMALDTGEWWFGVGFTLLGPAIGFLLYLRWSAVTKYSKVDSASPLVTMSGVLHLKRVGTKSFMLAIDDTPVEFVHRDVRRAVATDAPCVVEALSGSPMLVITARPGEPVTQPPKPRKSKRRKKR